MKTVGKIERVSRSGWYFVKEPTFHIPCLLAVGRYSEADSELCVALEQVAGFENVPKTVRTAGEDSVDPSNCVGVHVTVCLRGENRCRDVANLSNYIGLPKSVQVLKIGYFLRPLRDTSVPRLFLCSLRPDLIRT